MEKEDLVGFEKALEFLERSREFDVVCNEHLQRIGLLLELQAMHGKELITALDTIYKGRQQPWTLKTKPSTYTYFKPSRRLQRPNETQKPLLFQPTV